MFLRFLPPAFGVAARRLLLRRLCSSQSAAAAAAGTSPPAMTRRLLTMMMKPQSRESKLHGMAAAAALSAGVGGGAWWYTSSKINKEDDDLSRMRRRVKEWIRGEIYRPADRSRSCDSGCDDTYRGFMAAMDIAHDGGAVQLQSLRRPSSSSEKEAGGGGGGCVSPAPARRFGFLIRLFFRPPPPSEVDWVEAGAVSRVVRRQKKCGCCWAMATVGSVEAEHYLKTKEQISLSVQELIDCVSKGHGCNGGIEWDALDYIQKNGLSTESSYPYMARVSRLGCKEKKTPATGISGWEKVFPTEGALERAVAKRPVVVVLQCSDEFFTYKGGIMEYRAKPYSALRDGTDPPLHAVLMVGYGTDANGVKYWRFKNSWGAGWGEEGFGRIRRRHGGWRGVAGLCMTPGAYPISID